MTIRNAALASAALLALAACRGGHQAASELLPDLDQLAPSAVSIVEKDGTQRLVFLSAVENVGRGPLLVAGQRPTRDRAEMSGRQLVRRADGSTATYSLASRFRFVVSETHRHWHLLDFERYELRTPGGKAVGRDHKTGFCLGDRYDAEAQTRIPGEPREAVWTQECGRGQPQRLRIREGLSPGYRPAATSLSIGSTPGVTCSSRATPTTPLRFSSYSVARPAKSQRPGSSLPALIADAAAEGTVSGPPV